MGWDGIIIHDLFFLEIQENDPKKDKQSSSISNTVDTDCSNKGKESSVLSRIVLTGCPDCNEVPRYHANGMVIMTMTLQHWMKIL